MQEGRGRHNSKIGRREFLTAAGAYCLSLVLPSPLFAFRYREGGMIHLSEHDIKQWGEGDGKNWGDDDQPADQAPHPAATATRNSRQEMYPGVLPMRIRSTGEAYTLIFRTGDQYDLNSFGWVNWLLRCHGDHDAVATIDYRLVEQLGFISHWFGGRTIIVNSGYRTLNYNRKLSERNHKVAPNSYHMAGRAADFSVDGASLREVCSVALYCRNTQGFGGIGYYPRDGFIHIDTGPHRQWIG